MKGCFTHSTTGWFSALIWCCLVLSSCSIYKNVPENDKLFTGRKIVLPDSTPKRKELRNEMENVMRPSPNSSLLGFRLKLMLYNAIGEPKKKTGFKHDLKYKYGEAPVLLSQTSIKGGAKRLEDYMFSVGYLKATVKGQTKTKGKDAQNIYEVNPGIQYKIRKILMPDDTSKLSREIVEANKASLLEPGQPVNLTNFKAERSRIELALKEKGYFFFMPDILLFRLDTLHHGEVDVYLTIKEKVPPGSLETWDIGTISVYGNYTLEKDSIITRQKGKRSKQYTIIDKRESYKTELYDRVILMEEGKIYNREQHNLTIERLMNLNTFRFVKTAFFPDTLSQANILNTRIYLTPAKKQSLKMDVSGYSKSNNFYGSEIALNYRNINVVKGAEIIEGKISYGFDQQFGGNQQNSNAYSLKGEVTYFVPKLLPNIRIKANQNPYLPRTFFTTGIEFVKRPDQYTLHSTRFTGGYHYKQGKAAEHTIRLVNINIIDPRNITPLFDSILAEDLTLKASFEKQLIIGSQYNFVYNNTYRKNARFNYTFEGNLGTSGNLASLFIRADADTAGAKQIFGIPISQFIRAQGDVRGYLRLNNKSLWVNRIIIGGIFPFGNSKTAPYSEQFFIGGSSSLRAFRIRTLGPGSYHTPAKVFQANESGELKLELNTELRYTLTKMFRLGGFVDAGNIWLRKDAPDKPGSGLSKGDLFKEMAVGGGLGLRIDASVLVIRFDFAIPFRKPWYEEGNRWVFNEIDFANDAWRKENLVLNIAIGYPF